MDLLRPKNKKTTNTLDLKRIASARKQATKHLLALTKKPLAANALVLKMKKPNMTAVRRRTRITRRAVVAAVQNAAPVKRIRHTARVVLPRISDVVLGKAVTPRASAPQQQAAPKAMVHKAKAPARRRASVVVPTTPAVVLPQPAAFLSYTKRNVPQYPRGAYTMNHVSSLALFRSPEHVIDFMDHHVYWKKSISAFTVVAVFMTMVIGSFGLYQRGVFAKTQVLQRTTSASANLEAAQKSLSSANVSLAADQFGQARTTLEAAQHDIKDVGIAFDQLVKLVPQGRDASRVLDAGVALASAGEDLAAGLTPLLTSSQTLAASATTNTAAPSLTEQLAIARPHLSSALEKVSKAQQSLQHVSPSSFPQNQRGQITQMTDRVNKLQAALSILIKTTDDFAVIFGGKRPMTYLIVNQNTNEQRATGGFIGSAEVVTFNNGRIEKMKSFDIYDAAGQTRDKIVPPAYLQNLTNVWQLQDANISPDFPTSAKLLAYFYELSEGGTTVDGVMALTPDVMKRLLAVTGPIAMDTYGVTVDAQNFTSVVEAQVESVDAKDQANRKQILADLTPKLLDGILHLQKEKLFGLFAAMGESFSAKDIQVYFSDAATQRIATDNHWDGSLLATKGDYLAVVADNIGGGKTSQQMEQTITHTATVQDNGQIVVDLTVQRKSTAATDNVSWMRFFVPQGTKLVRAEGFTPTVVPNNFDFTGYKQVDYVRQIESKQLKDPQSGTLVYDETGKTVFANWLRVPAGKEVTMHLTYVLPFVFTTGTFITKANTYSLLVQRQVAAPQTRVVSRVVYANRFKPLLTKGEGFAVQQQTGAVAAVGNLSGDAFYAVAFQ